MEQKKNPEGKGRGRPRAYDPQTALQKALEVFWNTGYAGASLDSIAAAAGMNRPSLYAAFGDKHAIYLKAIEQYWDLASAAIDAALAEPGLSLADALIRLYEGQLSIYFSGEGEPRGCFIIGTAPSAAVEDAEIRAALLKRLDTLDTHLHTRLRAAIDAGDLKRNTDPEALAVLASSLLHSISIRARAGKSRDELTALAHSAVKVMCA
ncbi:TetR/AcrR family transcriptional regulator [Pseudomonas sp. SDO528_S397]